MAFVLDASVAAAWVVPSQATAYTRGIRLRAKRPTASGTRAAEVTNAGQPAASTILSSRAL